MTAFDAPKYLPAEDASTIRTAIACMRARFGVVASGLLALSALVGAALVILLSIGNLPSVIDTLVVETRLFVVVDNQVSRTEAAAMKSRLVGFHDVLTATLKTREEGMASLGLDGDAVPRGQNPLPDSWIVTLRPPSTDRSLAPYFDDVMKKLAALPGVSAVTLDTQWVAALGTWQAWIGRVWKPALVIGSVVVFGLLICIAFLMARACMAGAATWSAMSVLACIGMLVAVAACSCGLVVLWIVGQWLGGIGAGPLKTVTIALVRIDTPSLVAIVVLCAAAIALGSAAAAARR